MPATDEQKAILSVLRLLLTKGQEWMRHHMPPAATATARVAEGRFTALREWELDNHLLHGGKTGRFNDRKVIYIKPPATETSSVAAIWCHWDFDVQIPKCGFYFGIWSARPAFPPPDPTADTKHTAFVGFRYETPEDGDNHNFYHAQPCRSMAAGQRPIAESLPIPSRYPTFPLAAKTSVDLLLCLVTSIYGMIGLKELIVSSDNSILRNTVLCTSLERVYRLQRTPGARS